MSPDNGNRGRPGMAFALCGVVYGNRQSALISSIFNSKSTSIANTIRASSGGQKSLLLQEHGLRRRFNRCAAASHPPYAPLGAWRCLLLQIRVPS